MTRRPLIAVTLDTGHVVRRGVRFPDVRAKQAYVDAVVAAGGVPLLVAPSEQDLSNELLTAVDGLVVTGGDFDVPPELYGASAKAGRLDAPKPARTQFESKLMRGALDRELPLLAICGGMQLLNVLLGGTLVQDIRHADPSALDHEQPTSPAEAFHAVQLAPKSRWTKALGRSSSEVNSTHHQAVESLGNDVTVWATAPDGVIEAFDVEGRLQVSAVQWHPELLDDDLSRALYGQLVRSASHNAKPRE